MSAGSVFFAGGGTGGHLYPALAIAERLAGRAPDIGVRYLCSTRPLDAEVLRAGGGAFTPIPAAPLVGSAKGIARFVRAWSPAVRECVDAMAREPEPAVVVAMGGFVSAPAVRAARKLGAPVVLVNLDAVPGRANRWVARRASEVLTAAQGGPGRFVGPIVRRAFWELPEAGACRRTFGLDPDRRTLLVTGGSQGARTINELLADLVMARTAAFDGWQVIHQCGAERSGQAGARDALVRAYADAGVRAMVESFIDDMPSAWGAADLCVTRGGAGAVAELSVTRTPGLVLPYPYHKDEHQRANALALEEAGGVLIRRDHRGVRANADDAGADLVRLLTESSHRDAMRAALDNLSPVNGAISVAECILGRARPA